MIVYLLRVVSLCIRIDAIGSIPGRKVADDGGTVSFVRSPGKPHTGLQHLPEMGRTGVFQALLSGFLEEAETVKVAT
jgi:hypothetical protein